MKFKLAAAAVAALALCASGAQAAELITNGGFDTDLTGWTTAGEVEFATPAIYDPCCHAGSGTNGVAAFGGGNVSSVNTLSQDFSTVIGHLYNVSFNTAAFGGGSEAISYLIGGVSGSVSTSNSQAPAVFGAPTSFSFVATSTTSSALFSVASTNDNVDPILDNVSVTAAAPEPSAWLLMLAGVGMIGATLRFQRRRQTAGFAAVA
jgi:hypothetical protein